MGVLYGDELRKKKERGSPFRSSWRLCRSRHQAVRAHGERDLLFETQGLEKDVALFFERESFRRGHQKDELKRVRLHPDNPENVGMNTRFTFQPYSASFPFIPLL